MSPTRYWLVVTSRDHALHGVAQGIIQVNHGNPGPLRRMQPGDGLVLYAPKRTYGQATVCQCFVALGQVGNAPIFQAESAPGFVPFRRPAHYQPVREVPIRALLDQLTFLPDKTRWGYPLRAGCVELPAVDFALIRAAMTANCHA